VRLAKADITVYGIEPVRGPRRIYVLGHEPADLVPALGQVE